MFGSLLFLMVAEGMPRSTTFQVRLDEFIDPLVDATGLWQDPWQLFAPEVDKLRTRISARFLYEDGAVKEWESPRWGEESVAAKFRHARAIAFYDRIRRDSNEVLWPSYAELMVRDHGVRADGETPVRVELWRHWSLILPPGSPEGEFAPEESSPFYTADLAKSP